MYLLIRLLGASVGSFINAFAYRWPRGESLVKKRSHCPSCKRQLRMQDLIPVLSFLGLRGKCQSCKSTIPVSYFVVELFMAASYGMLFYHYGATLSFVHAVILLTLLVTCAEVDRQTGLIPNIVLFVGAISALILSVVNNGLHTVVPLLFAAGSASVMLFLIRHAWFILTTRPGFGMGDIKLIGVICLFIGWNGLWAFYLAALVGAFIGLTGMAIGYWKRDARMPFAPALALGTIAAIIFPFSTATSLIWA